MRLSTRQKMLAARAIQQPVLAARSLRKRGPVAEVRRCGVRWELDLREGIDFAIWLRGYFELSTVKAYRRMVRPGTTVVDIGANIGAHTLHLAHAVRPAGQVFAFEPSADAFARLERNVALNPELAGRIRLKQVMLLGSADAALPVEVVSSWPLLPRAQLDPVAPGRAQPTAGAKAARLDDVLDVDRVDFVKLDVDGYEVDVLQGASRLLGEMRPPVLCELAPSVLDTLGRRVEDMLDVFASHRYRVADLRGGEVTTRTLEELRRHDASLNVVAAPV